MIYYIKLTKVFNILEVLTNAIIFNIINFIKRLVFE